MIILLPRRLPRKPGSRVKRTFRQILVGTVAAAVLLPLSAGASRGLQIPYGRRGDALLSNRYKVFDLNWRQQLTERGLLEYQPREIAGPGIDELTGEIAVINRGGWLRLLTHTGREIWSVETGIGATVTPLLGDEAIYVGMADGTLRAFDRFAGDELWSTFLGAQVLATPLLQDGRLFVGTDHDAVHALDPSTGETLWVYRRDTRQPLSIRGGTGVGSGGGRLYAGFSDGAIVALTPEEGGIVWQAALAAGSLEKFPDADAIPVYRDGSVYVTVFNKGTYSLDAANGRVRWQQDTPGATNLTATDGSLLVGGTNLWSLDLGSGVIQWKIDLGKAWVSQPKVVGKLLVAAGSQGLLFAEKDTGRPLRMFDPGSTFHAVPAVRGREIFALSNNGYLYALQTAVKP